VAVFPLKSVDHVSHAPSSICFATSGGDAP
jgi:hypothetical protein